MMTDPYHFTDENATTVYDALSNTTNDTQGYGSPFVQFPERKTAVLTKTPNHSAKITALPLPER